MVVHQCKTIKVIHEALKGGCACGTKKKFDQCISNCVRWKKKKCKVCCWFSGKVGHDKVDCLAREKSRTKA